MFRYTTEKSVVSSRHDRVSWGSYLESSKRGLNLFFLNHNPQSKKIEGTGLMSFSHRTLDFTSSYRSYSLIGTLYRKDGIRMRRTRYGT